jgi:NADP-dependent 3-hydroxy acid dehydrogenase YdfG
MARTKANIDIPNLRGRLALVTGASDGLGVESRDDLLWPAPR